MWGNQILIEFHFDDLFGSFFFIFLKIMIYLQNFWFDLDWCQQEKVFFHWIWWFCLKIVEISWKFAAISMRKSSKFLDDFVWVFLIFLVFKIFFELLLSKFNSKKRKQLILNSRKLKNKLFQKKIRFKKKTCQNEWKFVEMVASWTIHKAILVEGQQSKGRKSS